MNTYRVTFARNHIPNDDLQAETIQATDESALRRIYADDYTVYSVDLTHTDEQTRDAEWLGYDAPDNVDMLTALEYGYAPLDITVTRDLASNRRQFSGSDWCAEAHAEHAEWLDEKHTQEDTR